jgi:hypothetical protein
MMVANMTIDVRIAQVVETTLFPTSLWKLPRGWNGAGHRCGGLTSSVRTESRVTLPTV